MEIRYTITDVRIGDEGAYCQLDVRFAGSAEVTMTDTQKPGEGPTREVFAVETHWFIKDLEPEAENERTHTMTPAMEGKLTAALNAMHAELKKVLK